MPIAKHRFFTVYFNCRNTEYTRMDLIIYFHDVHTNKRKKICQATLHELATTYEGITYGLTNIEAIKLGRMSS